MKGTCALAVAAGLAGPALADDASCVKAARDHGSFKAVLSDAAVDRPQYELVKRDGTHDVEATRYVGGVKQLVRHALYGLFVKETEAFFGGNDVRYGYSHSIDVQTIMPLKPNTSVTYKLVATRSDKFDPQFSDGKLTVGGERDVMLGGCKLHVIDLVFESQATSKNVHTRASLAYAPDLAYSVEISNETSVGGTARTSVTTLRAIEDWTPESQPAKP